MAISCNERGIGLGGGVVQYICLVGPVNDNLAVYLVLAIDVYGTQYLRLNATAGHTFRCHNIRTWFQGSFGNADVDQLRSVFQSYMRQGKLGNLNFRSSNDQNWWKVLPAISPTGPPVNGQGTIWAKSGLFCSLQTTFTEKP